MSQADDLRRSMLALVDAMRGRDDAEAACRIADLPREAIYVEPELWVSGLRFYASFRHDEARA